MRKIKNYRDLVMEGAKDYRKGRDLEDSPYNKGSDEYEAWADGWVEEAEYDEDYNYNQDY